MKISSSPSKIVVFIGALLGLVSGYILIHPLQFGICTNTYTFGMETRCLASPAFTYGESLFVFSLIVVCISVITFFLHNTVFRSWLKFAGVWMGITIALVIIIPDDGGGFVTLISKEIISMLSAGLFVAVSIILLIIKSLLLRRKK